MNELVITTVALLNVTCWPLSIAREVFNTQWLHHKESNQCTLSLGGFLYKVMWKNLTDTWGHQDNNFTSMNIVCEYRIRIFVWFLLNVSCAMTKCITEGTACTGCFGLVGEGYLCNANFTKCIFNGSLLSSWHWLHNNSCYLSLIWQFHKASCADPKQTSALTELT